MRPLFVESSLAAYKEGLSGLVGSHDCPIVEEEGCQIDGFVDEVSLCASFRNGSVEAQVEGKEQVAKWVALLHAHFALLWDKLDKTAI